MWDIKYQIVWVGELVVKRWTNNWWDYDGLNTRACGSWGSGYHYCITLFNKNWTQVLHRFRLCSWHASDLRWSRHLTIAPAGSKASGLSLLNHLAKTIHHHYISFSTNKLTQKSFSLNLVHIIFGLSVLFLILGLQKLAPRE